MRIRPLFAALALSLLVACGGGGSSYGTGSGGGGTSVEVEGPWAGATHSVGSTVFNPVVGGVAQGGYAFFYDEGGDLYVLPPLGDSASGSGQIVIYAGPPAVSADGKSIESFPVTYTVSATAITGSYVFSNPATSGNVTVDFNLTPATPFTGNPSVVAGTWHGFYLDHEMSRPSIALTVQPSGVFVGNDANGCHLAGTITPLKSGEDLFAVAVDSTGGTACQGKLAGLAFETNTDDNDLFGGTTGTYYYFAVSNTTATGAFVAELKAP